MRTDLHLFATELGVSVESIEGRNLPEYTEATELELAEIGEDGKEHLLIPAAARAWRSMKAAARADDVGLLIVSAFRSIERQAEIFRRKLAAGQSIEEILVVCAPPGFSEHHTGCAVDISTPGVVPLEIEFEKTSAYVWLQRNAIYFGFGLSYPAGNPHGYVYEPWHWCFSESQAPRPLARGKLIA